MSLNVFDIFDHHQSLTFTSEVYTMYIIIIVSLFEKVFL